MVFHKPYPVAREDQLTEIPSELTRRQDKILRARRSALEYLRKLAQSARSGGIHILAISAFRTLETQRELFRKAEEKYGKGRGIRWLAPSGYSEHHTGYCFDLADKDRPETDDESTFENTRAYNWLHAHAREFGFELSFPQNNWQNVGYEPWHWRFVGDEESRAIFYPHLCKRTANLARSVFKALACSLPALFVCFFILSASLSAENVSFHTSDGVRIAGEFTKPARPAQETIVLLHGLGSGKDEWKPFAQFLISKGYGVLIYDARGHGQSMKKRSGESVDFQRFFGRGLASDWGKMIGDLESAIKFLKEKYNLDPRRAAVGGASIGANIALRYAAAHKEVPFAILLSPGIDYQGITTNDAILEFGARPLLLAVSTTDGYAYQSALALQSAVRGGAFEKAEILPAGTADLSVLVEPAGAGHGVQMFRRAKPEIPSALEKRIWEWIQSQKSKR